VLRRADAFAARMPSLRAATLVLVVLDPATGTFRYTTCGHPPPLVIGADGTTRYLAGTETGPLSTGSLPELASGALDPGELVLLYSDGLIERPNRTIAEGLAELAMVAGDAAANRSLAPLTIGHSALAMVEVFTNAIEHAYPPEASGTVELDATLEADGSVACLVTDHGSWQPPDPADADRGHGLMVAGHVVDQLLVSHPEGNDAAALSGTTVTLRHRLRRPAILASGPGEHVAHPAEPPFTVNTSVAAGATARALVGGAVDITTAGLLARRLLSASRGGTVSSPT